MEYYRKAANHMTFEDLSDVLVGLPRTAPLYTLEQGRYPALELHSYRGFYDDIEIEPTTTPVTVGEVVDAFKTAAGTELSGWKGGEFPVDDDAYMWVGEEGCVQENAVTGVTCNDDGSYTIVCEKPTYEW